MPANTESVARPTLYGNPFRVGEDAPDAASAVNDAAPKPPSQLHPSLERLVELLARAAWRQMKREAGGCAINRPDAENRERDARVHVLPIQHRQPD
jgi:hypothetical protein